MTPAPQSGSYDHLPKRRAGSGLLLLDHQSRVLIVEPTYKDTWEIPGGVVEAGEDPRTTCEREIQEELGLHMTPGRLLVLSHQTAAEAGDDSIMFVYEGGTLANPDSIVLNPEEHHSFKFVDPSELDTYTTVSLATRVRAAVWAARTGRTIELVNGKPATS